LTPSGTPCSPAVSAGSYLLLGAPGIGERLVEQHERIAAQPPVERVDPFELGASYLNG
jgi:hypothetical protein